MVILFMLVTVFLAVFALFCLIAGAAMIWGLLQGAKDAGKYWTTRAKYRLK